ncbi:MAG: excinuclease ABC subunit UvrC [SAR86 cluster bacterium]|nr:excinuclease ABC subunit UvrC [SAR86 cluster bacterium]
MNVDLKKIPETPGVYKFFNNSEIIYIGKAKNLKKRVSSYFGNAQKDRKTSQIKKLTDQIETFTTKNEVEALLLEQMLIRENKPKFNILLRDDKTYPYIYFSLDHDFPSVSLKRTKQAVDEKYFGPFVSSYAVKSSIKEIQKIFKIRNCSDNTFASRTRPCIEHQMKRCSAPCVKNITSNDYSEDITSAKSYLSSSDSQTIERLKKEIEVSVSTLAFEKAAEIRDRLNRLTLLREEQSVTTLAKDIDIFSAYEDNGYLGVCIIVVRRGKIRGTKTNLIKKGYFNSIESVYQGAILNFYNNNIDIPNKVLCVNKLESKELIEAAIMKKHNINIKILFTPSKDIRPLFSLCKMNSQQVISNHLSKEDKYTFAFKELAKDLGLSADINRIETFDVSHFSGDSAIASCVVFSKTGSYKKGYRLFNIPKEFSGNDIGSLGNVVSRRLKYFDDKDIKPELIVIDGGKTQLKFTRSIIKASIHNDIKVISIAKGGNRVRATETIFSANGVVEYNKYSKSYLLLQEMRDEAHRFAISAQRKKKQNTIKKSKLDLIPGIGQVLKKRLLNKFKNIKSISDASIEDLMTINGINEKIAKEIKTELN